MGDFNWSFEPEPADTSGSGSGFAQLGIAVTAEAPQQTQQPVSQPAAPALSRRELREREAQAKASGQRKTPHQPHATRKPRAPKQLRPVRPPRRASGPTSHPARPAARSAARPKSLKRRMLSKLMTLGAMLGAGLMMVSTSLPANAFFPNEAVSAMGDQAMSASAPEAEVQSLRIAMASASPEVSRDSYTAISLKEQIFLRYGNRNFAYTNDPNGTIQWPFPIAVPISDGFGYRISPCPGCSTDHKGVDFTPGAGAVIQAIADGTVSAVVASHYGLGNHVIIDHHINGQLVQSVYAHMADGSMKVVVGQQVKVTDEVGLVGSTGESTGAHLHLEIHVNGVPVDPFAWLKANAN
ncbi:MAG TPA: peptidoglycan DD-metalloendopeptidase family protein [Terrimesophilobacter sp.]|uniref:M23 family metallopeptidase n=1 Tax=Terrimesophilobacter sp. TaxID=2906435 RepID=UPI002F92A0C5